MSFCSARLCVTKDSWSRKLPIEEFPTWRVMNNLKVYIAGQTLGLPALQQNATWRIDEALVGENTFVSEIVEAFEIIISDLPWDDPLRAPFLNEIIHSIFMEEQLNAETGQKYWCSGSVTSSSEFEAYVQSNPKAALTLAGAAIGRVFQLENRVSVAQQVLGRFMRPVHGPLMGFCAF